jgi:hypothetical protein
MVALSGIRSSFLKVGIHKALSLTVVFRVERFAYYHKTITYYTVSPSSSYTVCGIYSF